MADDGTDQENLTNRPSIDREPNWWVGTGRIAYVSNRGRLGAPGDTDLDIWDISPGGISGFVTDEPGDEVAPAYSPDGNWIVYEKVGADREIYVARSSGLDPVNITNAPTNERAPDWKAVTGTNNPHIRPRGATPLRASLVLAYPAMHFAEPDPRAAAGVPVMCVAGAKLGQRQRRQPAAGPKRRGGEHDGLHPVRRHDRSPRPT